MVKNNYLSELWETLENIELTCNGLQIKEYDEILEQVIRCFNDKKESVIYFIGNGGSAAIASHMSADFMKNGGMNTSSLYDSSVITCLGNDYGYEYVFSKQLEKLLKAGDLLVAISSSGNSQNIVNAIRTAKDKNATVMTFTGFERDNRARNLGDINIYVPYKKYGIVESIHNLMLQQVVDEIMKRSGE